MPDINEIITLGIGTPSDIPHFILFGLSPSQQPPTSTAGSDTENKIHLGTEESIGVTGRPNIGGWQSW